MSFSVGSLASVGVLIFSTLSLEFTSRPRQEILTECLSWILIFICSKAYFYLVKSPSSRPFNASELGPIAFAITLICLASSVQQTVWSTAPLLGPALVIIERATAVSLPGYEVQDTKEQAPIAGNRRELGFLGAFALIIMIALFRDDPLHGFNLKLCWLFAQIVLYWGLSHRVSHTNSIKSENVEEVLHTALELASYMSVVTPPLVILWWQGVPSIPLVGVVSILKAVRWLTVLYLAHKSKLSATAWTTIYAVCTNSVWAYPYAWQASVTLVGSLAALYRISKTFPQSSKRKWMVLIFALCPLWAFRGHIDLSDSISTWPKSLQQPQQHQQQPQQPALWTSEHHPIYHLAEEARARFDQISARQPQDLNDAVVEYKRRYGRAPPPGFDKWFEFAVDNKVQWINEYDFLTKSFEPYWQMPPDILRNYVDQAHQDPKNNFNVLYVKDKKARLERESFQHRQLVELIQPIVKYLPDFKAILNEPDEPRVMIPYDKQGKSHLTIQDPQAEPVYFNFQDKQIIWDSITLSCPPDSLARSGVIKAETKPLWPMFVSNLTESQDICLKPATDSTKHGFLSSPSTFHYTHRPVPVLATAKFSTFSDIMIPSSYYFQGDIAAYDEKRDIPYEEKKDILYWRGTGTGGHWTKGSWSMGHRQRFVNFTNFPDADITLLQKSQQGKWSAHKSTVSELSSKFDVKFMRFIQCDQEDCDAQEKYFDMVPADSNDDANQFKILYNLDGNSFSGRYYRFLKSNSLVFMQAMFKEWHDDRILPWVHFVPIGLSTEELPEATRYLLDDEEGKMVAARMASESRAWSRLVLRPVDLTAAYYRAFLEYARLIDDERSTLV